MALTPKQNLFVQEYTKQELEELNAPKYKYNGHTYTEAEAVDRQRAFERQIRRWKREKAALDAAGLDSSQAAAFLRRAQARYRDFLEQTGLKRQYGREQVLDRRGSSGKAASSGGFGNPGEPEHIGDVDFSDEAAVLAQLQAGEDASSELDYEVNYTVTTDGKVWRVVGESSTVNPESIPSGLAGSYSYHNHPREATWFSFSASDVAFFISHAEAFSKASDYLFEYVMRRTEKTVALDYDFVYHRFMEITRREVFALKMDGEIDPDYDEYDAVLKVLSKEMGFEYERQQKSP